MTCTCKRKGTNCGACDDTAPDAPQCPPRSGSDSRVGDGGSSRNASHGAPIAPSDVLVRLRADYAGMDTSGIAEELTRHCRTREETADHAVKAYAEKRGHGLVQLVADRFGMDVVPRDHARKGRANWGKHRPSPRGVITPAPRRGRK